MPVVLPFPQKTSTQTPEISEDMHKRIQLLQKLAFSESGPGADAVMAADLLKEIGNVYEHDFLSEEERANKRSLPSIPEREKDKIRMEMQILASRDKEPSLEETWKAFEDAFNAQDTHRIESGKFHSKALRITGENLGAFSDGVLDEIPLYKLLKDSLEIDPEKDLTDEAVDKLAEKADQLIGVVTDAASGDFSLSDIKEMLGVSVLSTDMLNEMSLQLTQIKGALTALRTPVKAAGEHGDQWKREEAKKISRAFGKVSVIAAKVALNVAVPETNAGKIVTFIADAITADSDAEPWLEKRMTAAAANGKKADAILENWETDTRLSALNAVTDKERLERRKGKFEQAYAVFDRVQRGETADLTVAERGLLHALKNHGIESIEDLGSPEDVSGKLRGVPYFSFVRDADGNVAQMIPNPNGNGFVFRDPLMTAEQCAAAVSDLHPKATPPAPQEPKEEDHTLGNHIRGVGETIADTGIEHVAGAVLSETASAVTTSLLSIDAIRNLGGAINHKMATNALSGGEKKLLETRKTYSKIAKEAQARAVLEKIQANRPTDARETALYDELKAFGISSLKDLKEKDALEAVQIMESPHFLLHANDGSVLSGMPDMIMSAKETQIRALLDKAHEKKPLTAQETKLKAALAKEGISSVADLTENKFLSGRKKLSLACENTDDSLFEKDADGFIAVKEVPFMATAQAKRDETLGKFQKEAHTISNSFDKRQGVKAYEDDRLLIALERIGERRLTIAKKREAEMQAEKMRIRDVREKQAIDVLNKSVNGFNNTMQPWEKVLLVKLHQANVFTPKDLSKEGDSAANVNRNFIRRGFPDMQAKPVVDGDFTTLEKTHLSVCEQSKFAETFESKPRIRTAHAVPAPKRPPVKAPVSPNTPQQPTVPPAVKPNVKPTPVDDTKKPQTTDIPPKQPDVKPVTPPVPPPSVDLLSLYAKNVFKQAEQGIKLAECDQVMLAAMLANDIHTADDLDDKTAADALHAGLSSALKNGKTVTQDSLAALKAADLTPEAAHGLMSYLATRKDMPALRMAQAKGVLKKQADSLPLNEWEYCLSTTLKHNGIESLDDMVTKASDIQSGLGVTQGGFDRLSVSKLPEDLKSAVQSEQESVGNARETQAAEVLNKLQNDEKLNDSETVLAALLVSQGITVPEQISNEHVRKNVRDGLPDGFIQTGLNRDFSKFKLEELPPAAARATMLYQESVKKAQTPPAVNKAQILQKYASAMSRVDIYEQKVELPREFAKKKAAQTAAIKRAGQTRA